MHFKVGIRPREYGKPGTSAILTDEHSASSDGQPVLVMADGPSFSVVLELCTTAPVPAPRAFAMPPVARSSSRFACLIA